MYESNSTNAKKIVGLILVGILILLAVITFFSSMRTVDTGKVGVVTQYGRVSGRELGEGFSWVAPWGVDNVTEYDIKVQKEEITAPAATKDLQDVQSTLAISYQLKRGSVSFVHQEYGKDYAQKILPQAVQETFKAVSAKYTASELITERAAVKQEVTEQLSSAIKHLSKDTIMLNDVSITNFTFSEEFNKAIEAVQIANQKIAQARQELETTKVEAEKTIAEAQAKAEAQRLQQQTLTPEILQQEAIKKWKGDVPTYYGGGDGGFLFNIPAAQR